MSRVSYLEQSMSNQSYHGGDEDAGETPNPLPMDQRSGVGASTNGDSGVNNRPPSEKSSRSVQNQSYAKSQQSDANSHVSPASEARSEFLGPTQEKDTQTPEDKALAEEDLQRYLNPNADNRCAADPERRNLLASVLMLAKQTPAAEPRSWELDKASISTMNFYDSSMYPSPEFLYLMLSYSTNSDSSRYFLDMNVNGSLLGFEKMAQALLEGTVHGRERVHYIVCVNCTAYMFLAAIDSNEQNSLRKELSKIARRKFRENINAAVHHLDTYPRQDPLLMQALLSAAMVMQDTGYMRRCWELNSAACRVGALLTGSWIAERAKTAPADEIFEIRLNLMKCYVFDRALASNANQPASLVEVDIDTSVLDTSKQSHAMMSIMVEIGKAHDVIIRETRALGATGNIDQVDTATIRAQGERVMDIIQRAKEFRSQAPASESRFLISEWAGIDFVCSSTLTSIGRLSAIEDRSGHQSCLNHARDSLSALKTMLEIATPPTPYRTKCISSIAWLVPLFTLRPLFLLFRSLVATSDALDLRLIQDIAQGLRPFSETHHSILTVERLCQSLISQYSNFATKVIYSRNNQHTQHPPDDDPVQSFDNLVFAQPPVQKISPNVIGPRKQHLIEYQNDFYGIMQPEYYNHDSNFETLNWQSGFDWLNLYPVDQ
ncbi:hypothetical protein P175DRAFT_0533972 [Aspergillus ochraceoroseus IBT 24754]|uniref:Transcription factor domain-containing protein n=1 Tax=Aspergillus ochraceoroseus IBT 24754 TaxID=1392256 RepID=A0A2T5LTC3_9EURO|nr:uncharacterized protein P175DRAFT_0533972 [Aspergillus ochraceoroseus IBT 24754]PTU19532.1 hypothetical protein P175DRAFT_0533972 [Aspergillus ochraceoroseus IBT 24754]